MPIRAELDNISIHSFDLDESEWKKLKSTYKSHSLKMPCCGKNAIPKTSKLGTQYFAHSRRGECTSKPETQDHLYLKYLVANTAKENGWRVTTEYASSTPTGENWIADVFCEKGNARIAIEIQWSYQCDDEYERRTNKYKDSGVRCAWLYRINRNTENDYNFSYFKDSYDLPRFGFKKIDEEYVVPRYETYIKDFVKGLLKGEVKFLPDPEENVTVSAQISEITCPKCSRKTALIEKLDALSHGVSVGYMTDSEEIAMWANNQIEKSILLENNIGKIKTRVVFDASDKEIEDFLEGKWSRECQDGTLSPLSYKDKYNLLFKMFRWYKEVTFGCHLCDSVLIKTMGTELKEITVLQKEFPLTERLKYDFDMSSCWHYNAPKANLDLPD